MPDPARAADVIGASPLFDPAWYAAAAGLDVADRAAALAHYVAHAATLDLPPHPLFEPRWLYPAGRWRATSSDPLSHFLARSAEQGRSTHPLLGPDAAAWIAAAGPETRTAEIVGRSLTYDEAVRAAVAALEPGVDDAAPRSADLSVVLTATGRFQRVLWWLRQLVRLEVDPRPDRLELVVVTGHPADRRMGLALAALLPRVRVLHAPGADRGGLLRRGLDAAAGAVTVLVDPRLDPPATPWLDTLTAALDTPGAGAVAPLLVEADQTIVAAGAVFDTGVATPFLPGCPSSDAARMAHRPVPAAWPGVVAVRTEAARGLGLADETDLTLRLPGPTYVVPAARIVVHPDARRALLTPPAPTAPVPPPEPGLWAAAGWVAPGRRLAVREGHPALTWSIDIAAPLAPRGRRWGDDPFARSLARALEDLGQYVEVDHPETRGRATRAEADVVLALRGLERVRVEPGPARLLWVISHPDEVSPEECADYDLVLAAGPTWAAERGAAWGVEIRPLLQCTDTERFHPAPDLADTGPDFLFVGNSRGELRPSVALALEQRLDLTLYGDGWAGLVDADRVAAPNVPNDRLGGLYASAGLVLGDHWDDMRRLGFVSNRTFDVLATGARLLSDDVAGLDTLLDGAVRTWSTPADFRALTSGDWRARFPDADARRRTAERVRAEHSFAARARTLLDAVLSLRDNVGLRA